MFLGRLNLVLLVLESRVVLFCQVLIFVIFVFGVVVLIIVSLVVIFNILLLAIVIVLVIEISIGWTRFGGGLKKKYFFQ